MREPEEKKGGGIGLIIGLGKPKPKADKSDDPKRLAAQGLIDAIGDKDADAVAEAFETLYEACSGKPGASEDAEGEDVDDD